MPINPIIDREAIRMSTYQVRFKNTSEATVLKKKTEKKNEKRKKLALPVLSSTIKFRCRVVFRLDRPQQ